MEKIKLVILFFLFIASSIAFGQDYKKAIGFRGGFPTAITGKYFVNETDAVEGLLSGYRGGFEVTGLYEKHANAFDIPYLNWYYGAGAHIGFFDNIISRPSYFNNNRSNGFVLGIDGILGIEYTLTDIPFVIGLDVKPVYEFAPDFLPWFQAGMSFRFYF